MHESRPTGAFGFHTNCFARVHVLAWMIFAFLSGGTVDPGTEKGAVRQRAEGNVVHIYIYILILC